MTIDMGQIGQVYHAIPKSMGWILFDVLDLTCYSIDRKNSQQLQTGLQDENYAYSVLACHLIYSVLINNYYHTSMINAAAFIFSSTDFSVAPIPVGCILRLGRRFKPSVRSKVL